MSWRRFIGLMGLGAAWLFLIPCTDIAQGQEEQQQTTASEAEESEEVEALQAKVLDVRGSVQQAPVGVGPTESGWTAVEVDDLLDGGTQLKTGFRSSVVLQFGPDTVVQIRKASLASIDDYYKTATKKTVNLGLGYGTVRGGSTEAELRTDVVVDSTVATLAKRGTEGWQMFVEPTTGRFRISLARSGLVEAIRKATGARRRVRAGEYATDRTMKVLWVNQAIFDREVSFYDADSMTETEAKFASLNPGGRSVVSPDSAQANNLSQSSGPASLGAAPIDEPAGITPGPRIRVRPEGDFGIPATLLPTSKHRSPLTRRPVTRSPRPASRR